ncbi:centromere protein K [Pelobates fuscus]|uniref:centromere protein K n=1 Tax=Pelobates fuscus TaxID=191477 RepID=UPI002FE4CFE3
MDKQDELLKEAEQLARYMSNYQHDLPPNISSTTKILENAKEDLLQECEDVWEQIQECQSRLLQRGTETLPDSSSEVQLYLLMMQVKALNAEYDQWQKKTPEIITKNQDVLLAIGKEELEKTDQELEKILSSVLAKNKELKKNLEKEQHWLEDQQKVVDTLTAKLDKLKNEVPEFPEKTKDLAKKLMRLRTYKEELLTSLGSFLEEHFPLPEHNSKSSKKKKGVFVEPSVELITLHEILENLINKMMDSPHDPYIVVDQQYWPPYIELLLRYGIAQRHTEDSNRIRLEAFHQ